MYVERVEPVVVADESLPITEEVTDNEEEVTDDEWVKLEGRVVAGVILPIPEEITDNEWAELEGRAAIVGSVPVREAIEEAFEKAQDFEGRVVVLQRLRKQRGDPAQIGTARQLVDSARLEAFQTIDAAQSAMRDELAAL